MRILAKTTSPPAILLIEGTRRTGASVEPTLIKKGFRVVCVSTGKEAMSRVKSQPPTVVIFDLLTWHGNCARLCRDLCPADLPIVVLLAERQEPPDDLPEKVTTLARPFTARKLTNCIKQLVPEADGDVLQMGSVHFNVQHRHVRRGSADYHLTPMQTRLLEVFMRHPGETLSRRFLIKQVWNWNIDDLNDTRTLDVHVRWLREIVEDNADVPQCLTTVRGVGYRFGSPERNETGK
jgi:DNA-binding response OmpR family regulator